MSSGDLLLGIDGGQTATKSMLVSTDGTAVASGLGGPSDHFHIEGGIEKNRLAIHGAIKSVLEAAGADASRVLAIGLGLTGAPEWGKQNPIVRDIVREVLPHLSTERISVLPDYKTNLLGASGGKPGVVLIAGGGCISYGITVDGREGLAGGYGYLLGDQGSAFDIGLRAIDAATKADDLRGPKTELLRVVLEHFGLDRVRDITQVVYQAGFPRERISQLTPAVVRTAEAGDAVAVEILAGAAADAAGTAVGVLRQLFDPGEEVAVYLTGGVFQAGPLVRQPFDKALKAAWPPARATEPRFPPVVGALIVAARSVGIEVSEAWLSALERSLDQVTSTRP